MPLSTPNPKRARIINLNRTQPNGGAAAMEGGAHPWQPGPSPPGSAPRADPAAALPVQVRVPAGGDVLLPIHAPGAAYVDIILPDGQRARYRPVDAAAIRGPLDDPLHIAMVAHFPGGEDRVTLVMAIPHSPPLWRRLLNFFL